MPYGKSNKSIQNAAFKMKGINHGEGTGSALKQTEDDKPKWYQFKQRKKYNEKQEAKKENDTSETNKVGESITAMRDAYMGKASGKEYDRDINLFKDAYGDDLASALIARLKEGMATADSPWTDATLKTKGRKNKKGQPMTTPGIFNPIKPDFDYSTVDYGRGGKPATKWKKHTTEELAKIIKDKPHRFGGFDPVKDARRMNEILRPSKKPFADKFGKWKGGKQVRYDYGDTVRFHGFTENQKKKMKDEQKERREWHKSYKDQYTSPSSSTLKPKNERPQIKPLPESLSFLGKINPALKKSPLKFGRKHKK